MAKHTIGTVESVNGALIRLTFERWYHISESHRELVGAPFEVLAAVGKPDIICEGTTGEFLALKKVNGKYLVVVYREIDKKDGFIITAFYTSSSQSVLKNRKIIWQK
jgi:hypothetical protein